MPIYNYVAKDFSGEIVKGTEEAADQNALYMYLKDRNLIPVKISEQELYSQDILSRFGVSGRIKPRTISIFSRQFAAILRAGIPILKALEILAEQADNPKFKVVLQKLYEDVRNGSMLSEAMANRGDVFPNIFISMVEAGEISGTLDNSLESMANHFEKESKLRKKVQGALTYPAIVILICIIAVIVLLTVVVPIFSSVYESMGSKLPITTSMLIGIANFMKSYWYIIAIIIVALVVAFNHVRRTPHLKRGMDEFILRLPLFSEIIRKSNSATLARVLTTMLTSGISLLKSLEVIEQVTQNMVFKEKVHQIKEEVMRGGGLSGPIANAEVYPKLLSQMIAIGEESGALDKMLEKTAEFYEEDVDNTVSQMMALIEPTILLVMAVIVGFIVISVMIPMFNMGSAIQ